jgi:hypothetical protein
VWLSSIRRPDTIELAYFVDCTPPEQRASAGGGVGVASIGADGRGDWVVLAREDAKREGLTTLLKPFLGPNVVLNKVKMRLKDKIEVQFKGTCRAQTAWCVYESKEGNPYVHEQNASTFFLTKSHAYLNDYKCAFLLKRPSKAFALSGNEVLLHQLFGEGKALWKKQPPVEELANLFDDQHPSASLLSDDPFPSFFRVL